MILILSKLLKQDNEIYDGRMEGGNKIYDGRGEGDYPMVWECESETSGGFRNYMGMWKWNLAINNLENYAPN